jgi:hypothetical protein
VRLGRPLGKDVGLGLLTDGHNIPWRIVNVYSSVVTTPNAILATLPCAPVATCP